MERIGTSGSARTERVSAIRPTGENGRQPAPSRALTVIDGGRSSAPIPAASFRDGRAEAGFVTQLLIDADPTLRPSRLVRTRLAAASYAEMARRLA